MNAPLSLSPQWIQGSRPWARSIHEVAPEDWRPQHLFTSREYLSALEAAFAPNTRFDYALWQTAHGVEGGACFQSFDLQVREHLPMLSVDFPGRCALPTAWRPALGAVLDGLRLRVVVCGNLFSGGPRGVWCEGEGRPDFAAWLARTARKVAKQVAAPGVRVVLILKDVGAHLPDESFAAVEEDPVMALELSPGWQSLEDYTRALRHGYRREVQRVRALGAQVERREWSAMDILTNAQRIDALHGAVLARARVLPARHDARLFAHLKEVLGPRFSFVGYRVQGELVAFNTRFRCGEELESHYFGADPQQAERWALYKNLLLDDVQEALAHGCRRVVFGRDAQEVKSALGATPLPWVSCLRHESRTVTALLAAAARRLGPRPWTQRHPFRQAGTSPE